MISTVSRANRLIERAVVVTAGVAVGVAASVFFNARRTRAEMPDSNSVDRVVEPQPAPLQHPPIQLDPDRNASDERLRSVEERLAQLSMERGAPSASQIPDAATPIADRESLRAVEEERRNSWIARHRNEPADPEWAPAAQNSFTREISAVGEANHVSVRSVDCRSTTCIAEVQWPTYRDALNAYHDLLHGRYSQNCSRSITLPDAIDAESPCQAQFLLDCSEIRSRP
jgi:hypothetical protein